MLDTLVVAAGNHFPAAGQGSADRDAALSETLLCGFVGSFESRVWVSSFSFVHGCSLNWRAFSWPAPTTWILVGFGVVLVVLTVLITRAVLKSRSKHCRVDAAAPVHGHAQGPEGIDPARRDGEGKEPGCGEFTGHPVGKTVIGKQMVFGSWENMHTDFWGSRTGETTARAIPAILSVPWRRPGHLEQARHCGGGTRDVRGNSSQHR